MGEIFHNTGAISAAERRRLCGRRGAVLWLTGLSGSGKSTVASLCERLLLENGINAYLLDGDEMRFGLNADLGFSREDRSENIRRLSHVAALLAKSGTVALVSAISPFENDRQSARRVCESEGPAFVEIYVNTPLDECVRRDVKGLYKRAIAGEISEFTGISSPYETPQCPEITINTCECTPADAAKEICDYVKMLNSLESMARELCTLAVRAGEKIMEIYAGDFDVEYKQDCSPLTRADKASNEIICAKLKENYPQYAILSEESKDSPERLSYKGCFVVDPLDGTKEFVKRNGEFTVNIALSYGGKSVLGVVYAPAAKRLFYAAKGCGAFSQSDSFEELFGDDAQICVSDKSEELTVMASRSHSDEKLTRLLERNAAKIGAMRSVGSSLKGCLIASGEAEVYYRTGYTMEWDTAAMQCIVEQSGGVFRQGDGSPMTYNRENSLNDKGFFILNKIENSFE